MVNSYTSRMEDAIWRDNFTPEECEDFQVEWDGYPPNDYTDDH